MAIIRGSRPDSNFYVLDKSISEDDRLSWAARGLLVFLLGKPDSWSVSVEHLQRQTANSAKPTGRDGIYAIMSELMAIGYVTRVQKRDDSGRMSGHDYVVAETVTTPLTALPLTVEPLTANTTLVSTDTNQVLKEQEKTVASKDAISTTRSKKMTLKAWIEVERAEGRTLISKTDSIFEDGLPADYVILAWKTFADTVKPSKLQIDWRQTFRNYVRGDYLKLWAVTRDGQFFLTTAGKQNAIRFGMQDLIA